MIKKYGLKACVVVGLLVSGGAFAGAPGTFSGVFSPATVPLNGSATLTYTLTAYDNQRNLSFNATLPGGLVVANPNGISTNCGAPPSPPWPVLIPAVTAVPGSSAVQFSGGNTTTVYDGPLMGPRSYGCIVSVKVESTAAGSHVVPTVLLAGGPPGSSTGLVASPRLNVLAVLTTAASIPTLSEWGLILLVLAMAASAFKAVRRQRL